MRKNSLQFLGLALIVVAGGLWAQTVTTITQSLGAVAPTYSQANILDPLAFLLSEKTEQPVVPYEAKIEYEESIIQAVEKIAPAVVSITVSKNIPILENCVLDPFSFGDQFQFNQSCEQGTELRDIGNGSGFIVSPDGLIVTNKHVVSDSQASYTVLLNTGEKYTARVLAKSPVQDLAIIKIDETRNLPFAVLGNSDSLRAGQTAIAIGNPLGEFANTVSVGVVSGLARNITAGGNGVFLERLEGLIQTDAAINPGNSGGPLVNLYGEVIGINTATVSEADGIGFAIPVNVIKRDIRSVQSVGKIVTPFVGVEYITITADFAQKNNLPVTNGAILQSAGTGSAIVPGSPAAKAGLQDGDIITAINGVPIGQEKSLLARIQEYNVGDSINLSVLRAAEKIGIIITLESRE